MIRLLSLFSGIGAFESALDRLSIAYDIVNYCEIDKWASKSYSMIHGCPECLNLWDITKVDENALPKNIDLITYGFPCQDISVAGKCAGFENNGNKTRSGLFFDALRIIKAVKPKVAICENVKNLTSKKFKKEFETVLSSLQEAGYTNYWSIMNAKDYGVPQNRERVFIISIRRDVDNGYDFPQKIPLAKRLSDILESEVDEKFYLKADQIKKLVITNHPDANKIDTVGCTKSGGQRGRIISDRGICRCLSATEYKGPVKIVVKGNVYQNSGKPQDGIVSVQNENSVAEPIKIKQNTKKGFIECKPGGVADFSYPTSKTRRGRVQEGGTVSPTITATETGVCKIESAYRVRKITPLECFRLMGFSDDDFHKAEAINSNTQLYKQAGNSIVVDVLVCIFRELMKVLSL